MNATYMRIANEQVALFQDVMPALADLERRGLEIALLTNGPADGQRMKIERLGLSRWLSRIFISEEIGASKPSKEAFQHALRELRRTPSQVAMVGDSRREDVDGAKAVEITAVLLDRLGVAAGEECLRIERLTDLVQVLGLA